MAEPNRYKLSVIALKGKIKATEKEIVIGAEAEKVFNEMHREVLKSLRADERDEAYEKDMIRVIQDMYVDLAALLNFVADLREVRKKNADEAKTSGGKKPERQIGLLLREKKVLDEHGGKKIAGRMRRLYRDEALLLKLLDYLKETEGIEASLREKVSAAVADGKAMIKDIRSIEEKIKKIKGA